MHSDHAWENAVPGCSHRFCVKVRKRHSGGGSLPPMSVGRVKYSASTT